MASDIRAGAGLVVATLAAAGQSEILRVYHIDRGYENIERKLEELGAEITQVNITTLRDDVFYARIILTINGREMSIDSRPSDAIALAVRAHVPVFIAEDVMDEAASIPEENIEGEEIEGEPDERLDVFKDFVETLNLDDLETTEDDNKE